MKSTDHKQFRCSHPGCDKVFNRRDYLERHATNHLSVKPYVCVQCNRHFSRKDLYDNHLTTKRHARVTQEAEMANYGHHFGKKPASADASGSTHEGSASGAGSIYPRGAGADIPAYAPPQPPLSSHVDVPALRDPAYSVGGEYDDPLLFRQPGEARAFSAPGWDPAGANSLSDGGSVCSTSSLLSSSPGAPLPQSISPQALSLPFASYGSPSSIYRASPRMSASIDGSMQHAPPKLRQFDRLDPRRSCVSDGAPIEPHPPRQPFLYDPFEFGDPLDAHWHSFGRRSAASTSGAGTGGGSIRGGGSGIFTRDAGLQAFGRAGSAGSDQARFSAYGVSLGLSSSSSRTRSEGSISEDLSSSESDSGSLAAFVTERIRRDMAKSPDPAPNLRESQQEEHLQAHALCAHDSNMVVSSEPDDGATNASDTVVSLSGDRRYAWFFDDTFQTDSAKLGYDRCYSMANDQCAESDAFAPAPRHASDPARATPTTPDPFDARCTVPTTPLAPPMPAPMATPQTQRPTEFVTPSVHDDTAARPAAAAWPLPRIALSPERAAQVLEILREVPEFTTLGNVEDWICAAWAGADAVKHIVHPATFDGNQTHLSLLAVLALVGMALSEDRTVAAAARRAHATVFLFAYDALEQIQCAQGALVDRLELSTVNRLQAVGLLLRYERLVLIGDSNRIGNSRNSLGQYVTDMFLGKVLASVPHIGETGSGESSIGPQSRAHSVPSLSGVLGARGLDGRSLKSPVRQPIWATLTPEAYMFHQGAEPELQWREWVLLECVKRTAHFSLYCDSIVALSKAKPNPVSIFNMDIHMMCPEPLWKAPSAQKFLEIAGPTRMIANVPYLGLIKSLIRFPRVAQANDAVSANQTPWSIFALKAVAHGLIMLVGKLSGLIPHGDEMLQAVIQSRSSPSSVGHGSMFAKFDRNLQARLYRGLDVWHHYFTVAYGDVMKRIMRLTGSMSIPLGNNCDVPTDENEEIPQYALVIVLCHYSSFIFVHEDLPVVLQVTTNLKQWLETSETKSLQILLDYLYMPLYTNWIRTSEAKGMVSAATLYLAWTHAAAGQVFIGNHLFLSAMIYISVIVVWLYDFAYTDGKQEPYSPLRLDDFAFMDDAIDYVHAVYKNLTGSKPRPKKRAVTSLILLSACLLHRRMATEPLVELLLQLISVMDGKHSTKELAAVVEKSCGVYDSRIDAVHQSRCGRYSPPSSSHSSPDGDSEMTDGSDSDHLMGHADPIGNTFS